jgi:hypothetical protein
MGRSALHACLIASASLAVRTPLAWGQWTLTRVADTSTPVPGGSGNFGVGGGNPFTAPSYDEGEVLFWGRQGSLNGPDGVYAWRSGTLSVVADRNTLLPGTSSTFSHFVSQQGIATDGSSPTFTAGSLAAGRGGIYSKVGQQLVPVVESTMSVPGGSGTFAHFTSPSRDGAAVTFAGGDNALPPPSGTRGLYRSTNGQISLIADINTPLPQGGGNFAGFKQQGLSGSRVAFTANDPSHQSGVYETDINGGPISLIADTNTPLPGGQGSFTRLESASISGDNVSFLDYYNPAQSSRAAVYARINGSLHAIAGPGTPLPGGLTVGYCGAAAISGDSIAFIAYHLGGQGIFVWRNGQIEPVVQSGGQLNGISVVVFSLSPDSFDGDTLAFSFYDGTGNLGGIYTATIPAPAGLALLGVAALRTVRRRRGA